MYVSFNHRKYVTLFYNKLYLGRVVENNSMVILVKGRKVKKARESMGDVLNKFVIIIAFQYNISSLV